MKCQSMEYPMRKKIEAQSLGGKLTKNLVFWDANGVTHMDFLECGTAINQEHYIATVKTLKQW